MRARLPPVLNQALSGKELDHVAPLSGEARAMISRAARSRGFSARAVQSLRRVARTLADLDDQADIENKHYAQALGLRASTT